jgi:tetratricopeptide (TPR) repeat protein
MNRKASVVVLLFALGTVAPLCQAGDRDVALALVSQVDGMVKQGSFDKAADMCRRALAADDTCGEAHYQLGVCQAQLNQPREAMQSYQRAIQFGAQSKDDVLQQKARAGMKKLCPGVLEFEQADQKLVDKLVVLADEALGAGQLETASEGFDLALALNPAHARAKEGAKKAHALLEKRGDPVQAKLADAMLQETWYLVGAGRKDEAKKMASDLSQRYPETNSGREAAQLVTNDFGPPKKEEALALKKQLIEVQKAAQAASRRPRPRPPGGPPARRRGPRPSQRWILTPWKRPRRRRRRRRARTGWRWPSTGRSSRARNSIPRPRPARKATKPMC